MSKRTFFATHLHRPASRRVYCHYCFAEAERLIHTFRDRVLQGEYFVCSAHTETAARDTLVENHIAQQIAETGLPLKEALAKAFLEGGRFALRDLAEQK